MATALWVVACVLIGVVAYRRGRLDGSRAAPGGPPPPPLPADSGLLDRVHYWLAHDGRIQAIREVRSATGIGLRDAKSIVDNIAAGHPPPPWLGQNSVGPESDETDSGMSAAADPSTSPAALAAAARRIRTTDGPVEAMKYVASHSTMGLAEAKDFVDRLR